MDSSFFLDKDLLVNDRDFLSPNIQYSEAINVHGLYNPLNFYLNLSPRNREILEEIGHGAQISSGASHDQAQAFSTYLHENIHWWQHIGSTIGVLLSSSYPLQTHNNHGHLKEFFGLCGNKKSVRKFLERYSTTENQNEKCVELGNIIVNNAKDNEFFRSFTHQPNTLRAHVKDPFFESAGHASLITFMQFISLATDIVDPNKKLLPSNDILEWNLQNLKSRRAHGYFYGSDVQLAPIGALEIFEGQARINQLQYLSRGLGLNNDFQIFLEEGFLKHPYGTALDWFLTLTNSEPPKEVNSPLINVFLLVCDKAMNPTGGFTNVPYDFENFLFEVDPGIRFVRLCEQVCKNKNIANSITDCTLTEYMEISDFLDHEAGFSRYSFFLNKIEKFIMSSDKPNLLINELENFDFGHENMPMRFLLSYFLKFLVDKKGRPEVFCWPGKYLSGENAVQENADMFLRYLAPFQDKPGERGVFIIDKPGVPRENLKDTLNKFYGATVVYDLCDQYILREGEFVYEYRWLTERIKNEAMAEGARETFAGIFGVDPGEAEIL